MSRIVKLVGSGIGLVSEAVHNHRNRDESGPSSAPNLSQGSSSVQPGPSNRHGLSSPDRTAGAPPPRYSENSDDGDDGLSTDDEFGADEAAWELDEMAERVAPPSYEASEAAQMPSPNDSEEVKAEKQDKLVSELVQMAGPPPVPMQRLPCPVILPQRRPRNKSRGYVRAYAPMLQNSGISQDVWLKFLSDWEGASKCDPWIDAVLIAANVVGFVPELAAQIISAVVNVAAGAAGELQSRYRRNTYLDRVNQDLLMPRGLFAMVMAFKDELPGQQQGGPLSRLSGSIGSAFFKSERLDIEQTAAKYSNPDSGASGVQKQMQNVRITSGKTYTQIELPEAAPLVYPDLDKVVERDIDAATKGKESTMSSMKDKWKGAGEFVQDYFDRKAQAAYETEHQGSSLAVPSSARQPFQSRYSDPNHAANSGSLISLITGGAINPMERRQKMRTAMSERRNARRVANGRAPRSPRRGLGSKGQRKGPIRKMLQPNVLYLIVVNLPSEAEVQQSVNQLEQAMAQHGLTG
ncbi:hypothetical protein B0J13DRAFT_63646 [Dactylonectria estremocensis]|uniref:Uncharacterized protein n=1 Tax=Dactylonectria estremocensis TaxID=1079267 RepID=A0A9P9ENR4_9HYPO|nr:hypothetical protein B0J13DRAFT_63646 [Dactylonectria estremocensis]